MERASRCEESRWGVEAHSKLIGLKAAAWKSRKWCKATKKMSRGMKCKLYLCMKKVEGWQPQVENVQDIFTTQSCLLADDYDVIEQSSRQGTYLSRVERYIRSPEREPHLVRSGGSESHMDMSEELVCMEVTGKNAHGHVRRGILCGNLLENCRPRSPGPAFGDHVLDGM